jgi:hypothetical protein
MSITSTHKKILAITGVIIGIGGTFTALNTIFGVQVRPAWAWELQALNETASTQIKDLREEQLRLRLEQLEADRRTYSRELVQQRIVREEYVNNNQIVPLWLRQSIQDYENEIRKVDERRKEIQDHLIKIR